MLNPRGHSNSPKKSIRGFEENVSRIRKERLQNIVSKELVDRKNRGENYQFMRKKASLAPVLLSASRSKRRRIVTEIMVQHKGKELKLVVREGESIDEAVSKFVQAFSMPPEIKSELKKMLKNKTLHQS